jgi:hypothetical protein
MERHRQYLLDSYPFTLNVMFKGARGLMHEVADMIFLATISGHV